MYSIYDQVNQYCERTSFSFWAEPINAVSNLGFIIAGIIALMIAKKHRHVFVSQVLGVIIVIIGIGSFLFHTYATRWAELGDVLPIYGFQLVFIGAFCHIGLRIGTLGIAGCYLAFSILTWLSFNIPWTFNGSVFYLPTLVMLIVFAGLARHTMPMAQSALITIILLFCVSLTARSVDQSVCSMFPIGTHFIWHLINSVVLFLSWRLIFQCELSRNKKAAGDYRRPGNEQ